jgi:hypothetical protein
VSFCKHIISGGQTGVDRAALDFAIANHLSHGGWAPAGMKAEDGTIPQIYKLVELTEGGYRQRNKRNVLDSDGTLIINVGVLEGGTLQTQTFAQKLNKPYLLVQLDTGVTSDMVTQTMDWIKQHNIDTLNVAGPRESKRPGVYALTGDFLVALDRSIDRDKQHTKFE